MKHTFLKQLWVAFKIWLIALAANTCLGSLYLSGEFEMSIMLLGLVYGAMFSFPILIILLIVMHHCVSRKKNGLLIFRYVFIFGLTLTIISFSFFLVLVPGLPAALLMIALLAAVTGIASQYNALFRLADYDNHFENYLS